MNTQAAKLSIAIKARNEAVVAALKASNGKVIDDHGHRNEEVQLLGVAFHKTRSGEVPVGLFDTTFCCNGLYLAEDGRVHIDRWSVGGVVHASSRTLSERLQAYNDDVNPIWKDETGIDVDSLLTF